jgi:hypothetical protein
MHPVKNRNGDYPGLEALSGSMTALSFLQMKVLGSCTVLMAAGFIQADSHARRNERHERVFENSTSAVVPEDIGCN